MQDQKRASMILFLSDYKPDAKINDYEYPLKGWENIKGEQTNDAPTKCLIRLALDNNELIDTIFCIVSYKVFTENDPTSFDRFSDEIRKYSKECDENYPYIKIIPIGYDFEVPITCEKGEKFESDPHSLKRISDQENKVVYIYNKIKENVGSDQKSVYIDYTGGLRDTSLLMIAIIRYLEFRGLVCKDIVYSIYKDLSIQNIRYIYDMLGMINAVSEFVGTGNASQLLLLWKEKIKLLSGNLKINETVEGFIKSIKDFSDAISICKVDDIENSLECIIQAINDLGQCEDKDIFVSMFKTLIPVVREKMNIEKNEVSILDLAQWCLENNMLQQAVTIYNERILEYYFQYYYKFKNTLCINEEYKIKGKEAREIWNDFDLKLRDKYKAKLKINEQTDVFKNISYNIFSLKELKETDAELWCAMKYYHAIRIIRNDINHVSGETSDMSKTIREYLEKEGLGENSTSNGQMLKFERNREFISNTLKEAIKFSKGVCERDKNKVLN